MSLGSRLGKAVGAFFASFAPKDYVTVSVSLVALAVSGTTFVYNVLSQRTALYLTIAGSSLLRVTIGDRDVKTTGQPQLVLTNAGNRPIAILGVDARVYLSADGSSMENDCRYSDVDRMMILNEPLIDAPFVLPEGKIEIISRKDFAPSQVWENLRPEEVGPGGWRRTHPPLFLEIEDAKVRHVQETCYFVSFATVDGTGGAGANFFQTYVPPRDDGVLSSISLKTFPLMLDTKLGF